MSNLLTSFSDLLGAFSEHQYLDDGFDRANRIYAPVILMISASLLGIIQFFGDPIECTQDHLDATADEKYIKTFCWANGTYDIQTNERLSYYQWVPVVLALQAFFFQLPYVCWSSLSRGSGLNLPSLMKGAFNLTEVQDEEGKRTLFCDEVSYLMDGYFKRNIIKTRKTWKKKSLHNLTLCYLASKVLYLINLIFQLVMIDEFLNRNLYGYAFSSVFGILAKAEWVPSGRFPLLAKCRFYNKLRDVNDEENTKEQLCTLPLNLYNEKVFAGVTLMLIFLTICVTLSLALWIVRIFIPSVKEKLVVNILSSPAERLDLIYRFSRAYLRTDGLLVLKLIRLNMGVNTANEVVVNLFARFKKLQETHSYEETDSDNDQRNPSEKSTDFAVYPIDDVDAKVVKPLAENGGIRSPFEIINRPKSK